MPRTQKFTQDGKNYQFTPGKGGMLTAQPINPTPTGINLRMGPPAKVIIDPEIKRRRMNLNRALVGSARG